MNFISAIIENLWGVSLPVEQIGALLRHHGQTTVDMLLRLRR